MRRKLKKIRKEIRDLERLLSDIGGLAVYLDRETEEMLFFSLDSIHKQIEKIKKLVKETEKELDEINEVCYNNI